MVLLIPPEMKEYSEETRRVSPAHFLMKFESFSLLTKNGIDKYESRSFESGGYKWKLILNFGSDENENEQHVSVYVSIADSNSLPQGWEINAIFTFFVHNQLLDCYSCFRGMTRCFNAIRPKWGFPKLISKKDLIDPSVGYIFEDTCVFGAEVFVIKPQQINECFSLLKDTTMFKREWKVPNFSLLPIVWDSEEFEVGNYKWMIKLYPKGENIKAKCISMYLECVDSVKFGLHQKVKAEGFLRIKSKHVDAHDRRTLKLNAWYSSTLGSWGCNEFLPIADMKDASKGFLVNDCCFLETEFSVQALVRDAPKIY